MHVSETSDLQVNLIVPRSGDEYIGSWTKTQARDRIRWRWSNLHENRNHYVKIRTKIDVDESCKPKANIATQ